MWKNMIFQGFFTISLTFDLEVKGHMGQGKKGPKQRRVGSRQRQVASFL